jgi:hypothetical protein
MGLGLLAAFAVGGFGIALIAMAFRIQRERRRNMPRVGCAKCGYPARGLTTFTCPECGADLREVGITRRDTKSSDIGVLLMSGTCIVIVALGILFLL